jgi:hypothetical protein
LKAKLTLGKYCTQVTAAIVLLGNGMQCSHNSAKNGKLRHRRFKKSKLSHNMHAVGAAARLQQRNVH